MTKQYESFKFGEIEINEVANNKPESSLCYGLRAWMVNIGNATRFGEDVTIRIHHNSVYAVIVHAIGVKLLGFNSHFSDFALKMLEIGGDFWVGYGDFDND